jgi:hypothetical protein
VNLPNGVPLLGRYSAAILPVLVVAEQLGFPLHAVPALQGGRGRFGRRDA